MLLMIVRLSNESKLETIVSFETGPDSSKQTLIPKAEINEVTHSRKLYARGVLQHSYQVLLQYALEVTCLIRAHRR